MNDRTTQTIRYARTATIGFALLCIGLGLIELCGGFTIGGWRIPPRWNPATVTYPGALHLESYFFLIYAGLLLIPWGRVESARVWNRLFALLCVASVLYAFAMITEVMAKNYLAQAAGLKAKIPVFQAILLFVSLGQIPCALFCRKPELLD